MRRKQLTNNLHNPPIVVDNFTPITANGMEYVSTTAMVAYALQSLKRNRYSEYPELKSMRGYVFFCRHLLNTLAANMPALLSPADHIELEDLLCEVDLSAPAHFTTTQRHHATVEQVLTAIEDSHTAVWTRNRRTPAHLLPAYNIAPVHFLTEHAVDLLCMEYDLIPELFYSKEDTC